MKIILVTIITVISFLCVFLFIKNKEKENIKTINYKYTVNNIYDTIKENETVINIGYFINSDSSLYSCFNIPELINKDSIRFYYHFIENNLLSIRKINDTLINFTDSLIYVKLPKDTLIYKTDMRYKFKIK